MSKFTNLAVSAALLAATVTSVHAADPVTVRAVGVFPNQLQYTEIEKPFFDGLSAKTDGALDVEFRSIVEVGLKGFDAMRQLRSGVFQIMEFSPGYVGGDEPFFLGVDLPGVTPDIATLRKVVTSYREPFAERLENKFNGKLLTLWPFPAQVLFCKGEVSGIDDLAGKKIRTFSPTMAALVQELGGVSVSLPFSEVYPALQRGVADCAISGTINGYTAKWHEVTDHLVPLVVVWAVQGHAANLDFWNDLSPDLQAKLTNEFADMEADMWAMAEATTDAGITCNTGGNCPYGEPADMKLVPVSDADLERVRAAALKVVLPDWAANCERTYTDCATTWNQTAGKALGLSIE